MTLLIATSWIIHEPTDGWLFPALAGLLVFFTHWTAFVIMGLDRTYHAHQFIFSFSFSSSSSSSSLYWQKWHWHFLFVTCGRLSWLPVSFLLHVKYRVSYRIVSYRSVIIITIITIIIVIVIIIIIKFRYCTCYSKERSCVTMLAEWNYIKTQLCIYKSET